MGPDGAPLSIAAIEVAADGTVTRAVLTLPEDGGIAQGGAALSACTTVDEWASGPDQPMEDAPSPTCDGGRSVAMTRNAASATWAADVTPLLRDVARDGSATLMVVPVASADAPLGFDVQVRAPRLQSEVASGPPPAATTTSTTSPPPSPTTTRPPSPPSPATTGSDGYDPSVAAAGRDTTASTTSSTTTSTTALPAGEEAIDAVVAPRPVSAPPPEEDSLPGPWWQVALVVLTGDLLVLGRRVAQRAQRAPTGV